MNKKIIGIILIILVIGTIGFNFGNHQDSEKTIKIGVVYSLTGPASIWAENGINAAKLAVEEINSVGGINGKKLELVIEDSKTDPKSAVSSFQKLTEVDGVKIVIGDVWSFLTNPLIPIAESKKVVLISPTVMNHSVEKQSPYFYTVGHTVESQEAAIKKFLTLNKIKTVYDLCWDDAWGHANSNLLKKLTTELSIKIVGQSCTADFSSDYRTEAVKVKALNPDAVFLTSAFEDVAVKALYNLQVHSKVLTTTGMVEAVRARNFPTQYTQNVWVMDWIPNQEFIVKYEKAYGKYPILEAQNHYEVVRSIAKALESNPDNVLGGLKTVKYISTDETMDFTGDNITVNKAEAKLYRITTDGNFAEVK